MKQLYLDTIAQLGTKAPGIKYLGIWNNQHEWMEEGKMYSFPLPAAFVAFVSPAEIKQLGNGNQIYDPLIVEVHILQEFLHDAGNMERNLSIFDIRQEVYKALQKFEPNGAVQFIRIGEEQDTQHTNLYHFIQRYVTNYVDSSLDAPVDGILSTPPTALKLAITIPDPE